ncbi:NHLM bacteriocin system ABC transporter, peptidase/ATP-binding protein [Fulvimarina manganoxydans]|uniref:NHLM bacteriocin system ABC transporter, peptidase/ATP-binding protein n=1 Tax=Fulvimarina manganoxydans TaxID=937218 RepID=A0A1W2D463_9HYPH|nr:NHLP family bacteriocin export ABC transporter peptidase/permease/ATPase subunit [Fulvimarina manganoxydans]SMC91858.1 NHLM bacteriocin system ABC transporter, peptidase/ATP-binding protein [Fulvimarina manganoxydans]
MTQALGKPKNWRVRTPTVLQMEAVECGAAALTILMAYHGKWRPLDEVRAACGVSRDGSKAKNVLVAARGYGFKTNGRKAGVDTALAAAKPFIAFWNFNHFLVVEGTRNGRVYLNDPAMGPRTVSVEAFDEAFTGVMLEIEPGEAFQMDPAPPGVLKRLAPRAGLVRSSITLAVLISLTLVVPGLLVPGFSKIFIDEILIRGNSDWLRPLLAAMAVTAVVSALLTWLRQRLLLRMETKLALAESARFVWHLMRLPLPFFSQRHAGDISYRIDANDRIARSVAEQLGESLANMITVAFYVVVMASFDWRLTLVALGLSAVNIFVFRALSRRRADASARMQQDFGRFQAASVTGIQAIETLKATGTDDDYFERWAGFQAKHLNNLRRLGSYGVTASALPPLLDGLTLAAILGFGGYRIMEGSMTIGTLIAFQALVQNFMAPVQSLVAVGGSVQELGADLSRSDDVFGYARDPRYEGEDDPRAPSRLSGRIELKSVTFGYTPLEAPLIENFDLTLRPGARVALVGGSGSGKSTVAKLVSGLYRPWSGEILFDGVPLPQIPVDTLTGSIASVSQEIVLFGGTVRDNLSTWDATVPDAALIEGLRDAEILDVVSARGGALEAVVEEGAGNFSGGQAQRLEIARALSGDPSILILDEATSALDPTTEKAIDEHIRRRGCTCLIVAHRLSTIRDADEILVLERGQVIERGSHDELMALNGAYARLIAEE